MRVHLQRVKSSNIAKVGYDTGTMTLYVQFKSNNAIYKYSNVPKTVYNQMLKAASVGIYFSMHVKHRYKFTHD